MTEAERIARVPARHLRADAAEWTALLRRHAGAPPLRQAQADALSACAEAGEPGPWGARGAALLLGCGHGKTLVGQLAPCILGARSPLLLAPAPLLSQLGRDVATWRPHYPLAEPPALSYERLSSPSWRDVLDRVRPDLLVLDEAHALGNPNSARWRRISGYLTENPRCAVVLLSGTLTTSSLLELRHLLLAALRDRSPLPVDHTIRHWSAVIDAEGEPGPDDLYATAPLVAWAHEHGAPVGRRVTPETARAAFLARLRTTPGVVLAHGEGADVSLALRWYEPGPEPPAVGEALARLEGAWELPDGTELVDALEVWRARSTMPLGIWHRWTERPPESWVEARRGWAAILRALLELHDPELDSPAVIADAVRSGRRASFRARNALTRWEREAELWTPTPEAVWLPGGREWVAAGVARWLGDDGSPGLIWTDTPELGEGVARELGLHYHGAGSPPPAGPSAVAAIRVHGTGWNGQRYHRQLILQPPGSGGAWEQLLARTHRPGQRHDVTAAVWRRPGAELVVRGAVTEARYTLAAAGAAQRLLDAAWVGPMDPR